VGIAAKTSEGLEVHSVLEDGDFIVSANLKRSANKMLRSSVGVCFDIDGVLVRGKRVLPGAREAVKTLRDMGVPFVFLTNGGGHFERDRAATLSERLEIPVDASQVVLAHSPMRSLVPEFHDRRVMILGCRQEVDVAREYGFTKMTTPQKFHSQHPDLYSFREAAPDSEEDKFANDPVEALLVMHDPMDWHVEVQVCLDILLGRDPIRMALNNPADDPTHRTQVVPIFNSNEDFIYASAYPHPRLAQGAFLETLANLFRKSTGGTELQVGRFGKPHAVTFNYARKLLENQNGQPMQRIFMIGDNPDADVAGANNTGEPFRSVLLETGVYKKGHDTNNATYVLPGVWDVIEQLVIPYYKEHHS